MNIQTNVKETYCPLLSSRRLMQGALFSRGNLKVGPNFLFRGRHNVGSGTHILQRQLRYFFRVVQSTRQKTPNEDKYSLGTLAGSFQLPLNYGLPPTAPPTSDISPKFSTSQLSRRTSTFSAPLARTSHGHSFRHKKRGLSKLRHDAAHARARATGGR